MHSCRGSLQPAGAGAYPARRPGRCRCVQPQRRRPPNTLGQTRGLQAASGRSSERKQQRQAAAGERGRGRQDPSVGEEGAPGSSARPSCSLERDPEGRRSAARRTR